MGQFSKVQMQPSTRKILTASVIGIDHKADETRHQINILTASIITFDYLTDETWHQVNNTNCQHHSH